MVLHRSPPPVDILPLADDQNLAVRTYNEQLAREMYNRLSGHLKLLELWVDALVTRPGHAGFSYARDSFFIG